MATEVTTSPDSTFIGTGIDTDGATIPAPTAPTNGAAHILTPPERRSFGRIPSVLEVPRLVQIQIDSFQWFIREGMRELLAEISPISDFTNKSMDLSFLDYRFGTPRMNEAECRERDTTYSAPLYVQARLLIKETGEVKDTEIFMGDFPMMTEDGTFIINGAERVVVSQLVRSPGIYYTKTEDPSTGRSLYAAKLIPNRGAWLEFETSNRDILSVKVDRKRRMPVTILLRAIGYGTDEQLMNLYEDVDTNTEHHYLTSTLEKEPMKGATDERKARDEALLELYRRIRPGDPPTRENAENLLTNLFFNPRRYDLARVGRYKLNKRLLLPDDTEDRVLTKNDIVQIVGQLIRLNNGEGEPDDIDHLGNRRIRAVGELIQMQVRAGLARMERVVKERMTIQDPETATANALINIRPVMAAVREFFGGSQLSQFMDQTNPLAELNNKRRLSALGPGGLSRDRAGFDVRDVHHSHYGRICPIETPEGPNIGLIGSLATYGRINQYGFIETPYRRVLQVLDLQRDARFLAGQTLTERVQHPETKEEIAARGTMIDETLAERIRESGLRTVRIQPFVSKQIEYLSADVEEHYTIAQANVLLDADGHFVEERVAARHGERILVAPRAERGVHGCVAQAGGIGLDGPHPLLGTRRREPRPDGCEHAEAGSAAPAPGVAHRRHGHRVPDGAGQRAGCGGAGERYHHRRGLAFAHLARRRGRDAHVPAP